MLFVANCWCGLDRAQPEGCATEELTGSRRQQVEKLGLPGSFGEVEAGDSDGQGEAAGTGAARVDIEAAFVPTGVGFMGVAGDHDLEAGDFGIEVELAEVVEHIDQDVLDADDFGGWQGSSPGLGVHVAADGHDRRDASKSIKDGGVANVASVDDSLAALQGGQSFGAKQTVGVGD